jgi:hypothetical protein
MAFDAGSIVARITLDSSAFNTSINKARQNVAGIGESMQKFGQDIMQTSRQMSRFATTLTFIGAGITAPMILAFRSVEKYSTSVREEMDRLESAAIRMRLAIGEALVPIMHRLSNILADLLNRWNALSPQMRNSIIQTTFMVGVFLTLTGIISSLALKIVYLVGGLIKLSGVIIAFAAVHPILAGIAIALTTIVYLMNEFGKTIPVLNGIETAALMVAIGYEKIIVAMARMFETSAYFWGQTKMAEWWKGQADAAQGYINRMEKGLVKMAVTGKGALAGLGDSINEVKSLFADLGTTEFELPPVPEMGRTFAKGWEIGLTTTISELSNWGKTAENIIQQTSQQMQSSLSNFFQGFLKGQINSAKEMFVEFGNFAIKILSDVISQWITAQIMTGIKGIFGGLGGLGGGGLSSGASIDASMFGGMAPATSSFLGFQEGVEQIPYTGLFRLHEGEKVTPKHSSSESEKSQLVIYNLITPEAIAASMAGKEGEGVIVNAININSLRNGVVRREVKRR